MLFRNKTHDHILDLNHPKLQPLDEKETQRQHTNRTVPDICS